MTFKMKLDEAFQSGHDEGVEEGIEKGIEKGIEIGENRGIEKGIARVILQLLSAGMTPEEIAERTDYTIEEIDKIKEEAEAQACSVDRC